MPDDNSNPYAAPETKPSAVPTSDLQAVKPRRSIWRFSAVAFCYLIGGLSVGTGLACLVGLFLLMPRGGVFDKAGELVLKAALNLSFGGSWLLAGWCFNRKKDLWGVLAFLAGGLIPVSLVVLFGL